MACRTALLAATIIAALSSNAFAQRYPRVYSPTGRPYGPTVAGYQYQRQYGQPWHGYGGINLGSGVDFSRYSNRFNAGYGYPYTFYSPGYYGVYGDPYYGRPYVDNFYFPPVYADDLPYRRPDFPSPMMPGTYDEERLDEPSVEPPVPAEPRRVRAPRVAMPSSPETIARSIRKQETGDVWLKKMDYANAISNYRAAAQIAPDRADPKFRLGFVLLATAQFQAAIDQFQLGLDLDPSWPSRSFAFDEMIGAENMIEKSVVMDRVAQWVKQDVRDPNRLFLMGVTLHLDRRPEAPLFFDTAYKLTGGGNHLLAFLNASPVQGNAPPAQNGAPPVAAPTNPGRTIPVPPLPAPELGPGQTAPPRNSVTPMPQKPAPTVIPQKSPATKPPAAKTPAKTESDGAPPKPDSVLEKEKKETPPAAPPKPVPAAAPKPAPATPPVKDEPAAAESNSSESGPQLVPQG